MPNYRLPLSVTVVYLALAILSACGGQVLGQALDFERYQDFCRRTTRQRVLLSDMEDGRFDAHGVLESALIAAGITDAEIRTLLAQTRRTVAEYRLKQRAAGQPAAESPESLFRFLQSEYLGGQYQPDLYDVSETLKGKSYNCLTATLLLHSIGKQLGIKISAFWQPAHVRAWIPAAAIRSDAPGKELGRIIETTADRVTEAVGPVVQARTVEGRRLTPVQLVAKVLYNRGVQHLHKHEYAEALSVTWAAYLLDANDEPAYCNVRACFNNWALSACEQKNPQFADRLFVAGLQLDPDYVPFQRNRTLLIGK